MIKLITIITLSTVLATTPTIHTSIREVSIESSVFEKASTNETVQKIKKVAKRYVKGHKKGYRYESSYELLEENDIKVTEKNVKRMDKWVAYYEKNL